MEQSLTIVVGTTPDYVGRIQAGDRIRPLLFVFDRRYRHASELTALKDSQLLFSNLEDYDEILGHLEQHLFKKGTATPGFVCFDCESLYLTARLAEYFNSPFPSPESVLKSRNKYLSGRIWLNNRVLTPMCDIASDLSTTLALFKRFENNIVIKPVTGSGSELVFHCVNEKAVIHAVNIIEEQLEKRRKNPLFAPIIDPVSSDILDPCRIWVVEQYISGPEYSCDFFMYENTVALLRETGKIKDSSQPFGTISGYIMPPAYTGHITGDDIRREMMAAARALGFEWGYFMADFILKGDKIYMIELTPRPGGDTIPDLIRISSGTDIIKTYMDIMTGDRSSLKGLPEPKERYASIHFYTDKSGIIDEIDTSAIEKDPCLCHIEMRKKGGDRVLIPPDDYDNRLLGYCIVSSKEGSSPLYMCRDFQNRFKVTITS